MKSTHSWKWLVPRFISRHLRNSSDARVVAGRPCLALERLEDRNLLSASPHSTAGSDISTEPPPVGGDTQVVIGLLQNGLKVTQDQFRLLRACASGKHIAKAVLTFRQLDNELFKVGEDLINGELTDKKLMATEAKIDYLKIKLTDIIISSVDAQTQKTALPIVDTLFADAAGLVQGLLGVEGAGAATQKQTLDYLKISEDVLNIDGLIIKGELVSHRKAGKGQQEFFTSKLQAGIEEVFQKANEAIVDLGDPAAASALLPAVQQFHDGITTLIGSLSDGGNFEGGIVVPPTDDIIT